MTELTFIEIINKNEKNIVAGCIYKYPKQTIPNFLDNHLLPLLEKLFYQQLVLVTTTLQNFLYQYLNSLLLMNTLSNFLFYFVKKFLTKTQTYLWHLLIFSHCSQIYPWIKWLIFVLIWFSIKRRKLKACLSDISNNYLHFLLSHLVFFLMVFVITRLMV